MNFEGVGKSVEVPLHKGLLLSVKDHINSSYADVILNKRL